MQSKVTMPYILTQEEYNDLIHYKNEYTKPDSIGQMHVRLLVKHKDLKEEYVKLQEKYNKLQFNHMETKETSQRGV